MRGNQPTPSSDLFKIKFISKPKISEGQNFFSLKWKFFYLHFLSKILWKSSSIRPQRTDFWLKPIFLFWLELVDSARFPRVPQGSQRLPKSVHYFLLFFPFWLTTTLSHPMAVYGANEIRTFFEKKSGEGKCFSIKLVSQVVS